MFCDVCNSSISVVLLVLICNNNMSWVVSYVRTVVSCTLNFIAARTIQGKTAFLYCKNFSLTSIFCIQPDEVRKNSDETSKQTSSPIKLTAIYIAIITVGVFNLIA